MKKELKDVLHLYLGCEILHNQSYKLRLTANRLAAYINNDLPIESIKPILRPISDMTEGEDTEVMYIMQSPFRKNNPLSIMQVYAEVTKYLLSKHFDLFGLIEAGLAIDSTTINK